MPSYVRVPVALSSCLEVRKSHVEHLSGRCSGKKNQSLRQNRVLGTLTFCVPEVSAPISNAKTKLFFFLFVLRQTWPKHLKPTRPNSTISSYQMFLCFGEPWVGTENWTRSHKSVHLSLKSVIDKGGYMFLKKTRVVHSTD